MGYEILPYDSERFLKVIDLVKYFSGGDFEKAAAQFRWKYLEAPGQDPVPGIIALCKGEVVGFRGLLSQRWCVPGKKEEIKILATGDNIVHPNHRRKGISSLMRSFSLRFYEARHNLFLSLSSAKISASIHKKLGSAVVTHRSYANRYGIIGLTRFVLRSKRSIQSSCHENLIRDGNILVASQPFSHEMASTSHYRIANSSCLELVRDEHFFDWRFKNPRYRYSFYYHIENNKILGYMVIRLSNVSSRGYIFDYGAGSTESYKEILRYIIGSGRFGVLSIWGMTLPNDLRTALRFCGFKRNCLLRIVENRLKGEMPILVRPVGRTPNEKDWFVGGIDTRKAGSWHFSQICSDAL